MKDNIKIILVCIFLTIFINLITFNLIKNKNEEDFSKLSKDVQVMVKNIEYIDKDYKKDLKVIEKNLALIKFNIYFGQSSIASDDLILRRLKMKEDICLIDIVKQPGSIVSFDPAPIFLSYAEKQMEKSVLELIKELETSYDEFFTNDIKNSLDIKSFKDLEIFIMYKNGRIGLYKNGSISIKL